MQGNSVANTVPNYQHSQGNFYPGHDSEFLPFGSPANSPLLSYMQCDTYGQAAWAGYPCERARALAHQFRHVNGQCSCLNGCRSLSDHYCTGASCQPSCGVVNRYRPSCDQPVCAQPASDCDQPLGIGSGDHPALPPGPFIQQSRLPQNERRIARANSTSQARQSRRSGCNSLATSLRFIPIRRRGSSLTCPYLKQRSVQRKSDNFQLVC